MMQRGMTDTSREGWAHVSANLSEREADVLNVLRVFRDGMNGWEIAQVLGTFHHYISTIITRLVRMGLVVDSGERRKGPCDRRQIVWRAVP
jgi:DNA-binding MarR family transcriptional regulator